MADDWADTGFPLGCGPCNASPEVQQQWMQLHAMGCTEEYYADPPLTSTKIADRPISKLSRNFDFKIRAGSNSVADRLKHVEDVAELSRVLRSTSCGCDLYRGGCPKAVKSFLGYNWDDLIRVERLKRYIPGTKPKALIIEHIAKNTADGVFQPTFLDIPVCRDVWLYLSHTPLSSYQQAMREVNWSPEEKQAHAIQQVTGRIDKVGAHNKESAGDNQRRWLRTKIKSRIQNPPNRSNEATYAELQLHATEDNPDAAQTSSALRKPPLSTWYQEYLQVRILYCLRSPTASLTPLNRSTALR